jgi:hypothetical protein
MAIALASAFAEPALPLEWGPLAHEFGMTLQSGRRLEAVGPLFYSEASDGGTATVALPPWISYSVEEEVEAEELDFLYPALTYNRFGKESRLQLFQVLSFGTGQNQEGAEQRSFTVFPFYFQRSSADAKERYTALFPFHGTIKRRLFRDRIRFTLWPLYVQTVKKEVVTDNFVAPFFHRRSGPELTGWQFWPLLGR